MLRRILEVAGGLVGIVAGALAGEPRHRELGELATLFKQFVAKLVHHELVDAWNARQRDQWVFALAPAHLEHCGALDAGEGSELFEALRGQDHSKKLSRSRLSTRSMADKLDWRQQKQGGAK